MERRRRSSSRARDADEFLAMEDETPDERLDRLIQEEGRGEPAVRSVRISARADAPPARGEGQPTGGETQETGAVVPAEGTVAMDEGNRRLMEGLSPEQQGVLARAAEALRAGQALQIADGVRRPEFLPPPLQLGDVPVLAGHQDGAGTVRAPGGGQLDCRPGVQGEGGGERDDQRTVGCGGSLLLALPPADLVLRPLDLPPQGQPVALQPLGGHRQRSELALQDPGVQRVEGPEGLITPPRPPETNVFWSEKVRREVEGGVQTGQNGAGQPAQPFETAQPSEAAQRAGGLPHQHGAGPGEGARASVVLPDGLTHRDLLELEALQAQALKNVENQIQQEIARRKASAGGSGSYGTPQGGSRHDEGMQQPNISTPPGLPQTTSVLGNPPTASVKNVLGFGHTPCGSQFNPPGIHGDMGMPVGAGSLSSGLRVDGAQHPPGTAAAQVGESFAESLRVLELPRLSENTTALSLGDWLAVIDPIMSDLSSTSGVWWQLIVGAAQDGYRQWILSGPLDRLRLRPPVPAEASKWPRTEQRAVTMLLACLPEGVRRDLIASRRLSTVEIIYKLLITYQPGGPQERTVLLKDITEDRLGNSPSVQEVLNTLRMWRRNVNRANELKVTLPDTLVIVGVLAKWAEHISRLGGAQTAFRVATLRQDLKLDNRPDADQVMYFAEALQAEIEQVALSRPSTTLSSTSSSSDVKKKEVPKTASLRTGGDSSATTGATGEKPKCKFWGSSVGCKRGDKCAYQHSWEGIQRSGRCYFCSGEGHMKPNCPYKPQERDGDQKGRISKVNVGTTKVTPGGKKQTSGKDAQVVQQPTSSSSTGSTEEKPVSKGVEEIPVVPSTPVIDVTSLMKSLQSLKAVQLRFLDAGGSDEPPLDCKVALLDGGATHAPRQGSAAELRDAQPVSVELAHGRTTLYRHDGCSTLLSKEPIEVILPMRLLVENGYQVKWSSNECMIAHPVKGNLQCWRRQGCPVMREDEALLLLEELEKVETENGLGVEKDVEEWWRKYFPQVPDEVLQRMKGQGKHWSECSGPPLPWNRRRRRQIEASKGVILHLFSGGAVMSKKWEELRKNGYEVITLDISTNAAENLHNATIWSYLWDLASRNRLLAILGGPPCRSFSRLRHQRPGPRPLRARGPQRWALALPDLNQWELQTVTDDSALILKMLGLFDRAVEAARPHEERAFLIEHPADPQDYLGDDASMMPSVWEWEEIREFARRHQLNVVKFDQGRTGHSRRKPTTLMTSLCALNELDGLSGGGHESLQPDLPDRLRQTATWAEWSPGLVQVIKLALRGFLEK